GDDAADPDVVFRGREIGDTARAKRLQFLAEPVERMAAHVEAERFFFSRELLDLRPRRRLGKGRGRGGTAVVAAKQLRLPFVAIALMTAAVLDCLIHGAEEPRATRRDG